jgi:hypothetical protein
VQFSASSRKSAALRGGVLLYAAQAIPPIDAEIAEKGHLWTETSLQEGLIAGRPMTEIDCHRCEHYFVTWDEQRPHGCRAMGFKSRSFPSALVRSCSDGMACRLYAEKSRRRHVRQPSGLTPK